MRSLSFVVNCIIILPAVIFIGGFVNLYISIVLLLVYAYWLWQRATEFLELHRPFNRSIDSLKSYIPELSVAALMTSIWLIPSGIGGIGYIHHDANMTNTTFSLLVSADWPIWFTPDYLGKEFTYPEPRPFVYYFGYYLPATVIGKLLGWKAGQLCLFVWTWVCIFVLFMLLLIHIKKQNSRVKAIAYVLFLILFCLFGGLDWWANSLLNVTSERSEIWSVPFVFLSNTRLLYWAPHNTIPIWLLMGIILQGMQEPWQAKMLGPTVVSVLIWTPIGLIGVVPFLLLLLVVSPREQRIHFFNGWSVSLAAVTFIILATFITSNSFSFPVEWPFNTGDSSAITQKYALFLSTELITTIGVFLLTYKNNSFRERCFIGLAYVLLLMIPFLRIGIWNDWCAKTSVASLFIIGFMASKNIVVGRLPVWKFTLAFSLMVLSTLTAGEELMIALKNFNINLSVVPHQFHTYGQWYATEQRIGRADSFFYRFLAKETRSNAKSKPERLLSGHDSVPAHHASVRVVH